jgi:hypothetical protein
VEATAGATVQLTWAQARVAQRHGLTVYLGSDGGWYASARQVQKRGDYVTCKMREAADEVVAIHATEADE